MTVRPKTAGQRRYVEAIRSNSITFGVGPAGTGKTYLAMAMAVAALKRHEVDPSIVTPSAKEARATAELMRLMLEEPHIPAASLGSIRCPVTVMTGEFDCIDPAETQRIANAIPGARKVMVPGADHVLPKCAPDDVNRELFSLLRLVESSPCR